MNLVDILILAWLVAAALRGYAAGLVRQVLSFGGLLLGLIIGSQVVPGVLPFVEGSSRLLLALSITVVLAGVLSGLGDRLALVLQDRVDLKPAHAFNAWFGVLSGVLFVVVSTWLVAAALTRLPFATVSLAVERSAIVQLLQRATPSAPDITGRIGALLQPYGLPDMFMGPEPGAVTAEAPATQEVEAAAARARGSTVRIESLACGGIVTGSGFIVAPTYVVTNAHVVAGSQQPVVLNLGQRQPATVVWFDEGLDFAVLRTAGQLPGAPLQLVKDLQPGGSGGAVLGFPGGGPLRVSPATVAGSQIALGRDIYGGSISSREIYTLRTDIAQGNSGGPFVMPDGRVAGLIFGESPNREGVGYAVTARAFADDLREALGRTSAASSGRCLR